MIILSYLIALIAVLGLLALLTAVGSALIASANPPKGKFVPVDDARLHVDELGGKPDDETAVVLVHGASGNMEDLRIALGTTLGARYRTILIDRPGRGWSARGREMAARVVGEAVAGALVSALRVWGERDGRDTDVLWSCVDEALGVLRRLPTLL